MFCSIIVQHQNSIFDLAILAADEYMSICIHAYMIHKCVLTIVHFLNDYWKFHFSLYLPFSIKVSIITQMFILNKWVNKVKKDLSNLKNKIHQVIMQWASPMMQFILHAEAEVHNLRFMLLILEVGVEYKDIMHQKCWMNKFEITI